MSTRTAAICALSRRRRESWRADRSVQRHGLEPKRSSDVAGKNFDVLGVHNYEYEPENFGTGLRRILRYRQVNPAERWQSIGMQPDGQVCRAAIPAAYAESPFALQYYFRLRQWSAAALYPGSNEVFANQPYLVVALE